MSANTSSFIKLRRISISNYKGIDSLALEFPRQLMPDDPDILVMGGQNGSGKTSVMECCALLLMSMQIDVDRFVLRGGRYPVDMSSLLIRAGEDAAQISGTVVIDGNLVKVELRIDRSGVVKIDKHGASGSPNFWSELYGDQEISDLIKSICGFLPNPVVEENFLFFHSYRKIQEGNPEMGKMVSSWHGMSHRDLFGERETPFLSAFKVVTLNSIMSQSGIFDMESDEESEKVIEKLNGLVKEYAGGTIGKLKSLPNNTIEFVVKIGDGEKSINFDGLSSGQKELISTLFLVWYYTRNRASVVLIDEPELHLNAEWHREFVGRLTELAPHNQYIIATHSMDVMDFAEEGHRILLYND